MTVKKRSVIIQGHRTSVSVEEPFWQGLKEVAAIRGTSVAQLIAEIDKVREGNLSSAIRVFVLNQFRRPTPATAAPASSSAAEDPSEYPGR